MESTLAQCNRKVMPANHSLLDSRVQLLWLILTQAQKKSKVLANNHIMHILTCGEKISINAWEGEGEDLAFTQRHASPQLQPSTRARYCSIMNYIPGFHWGHWLCQENPSTILATAEEEVPMEQPAAFIASWTPPRSYLKLDTHSATGTRFCGCWHVIHTTKGAVSLS